MLVKNIIDYQLIDVIIEKKLQNVGKIFADNGNFFAYLQAVKIKFEKMRNTRVRPKRGTLTEIQKEFPMSKAAISKYLSGKLRNATGNKIKQLALELGGDVY